jgi:transcriptional regulator with XRE-family HTH domain
MPDKPRGRPPKPLDPAASHAARLGAEIRGRRLARGLTQQALADPIGCAPQQVSTVEHATSAVSGRFVRACDAALDAHDAFEDLLPAVLFERMTQREERAAARRVDAASLGQMERRAAGGVDGGRAWAERSAPADQAVVDADRNDLWTAFGPTNVAVHTVTIAVELGDPGYALKQAERVRLSRLPVAERRAHHLLDVARAHGQSRQDTEAVSLVLAAEKLAPEEVRLLPATRTLICDILHRAPVVGGELRDLAHRLTAA